MSESDRTPRISELTTDIVCAYVSHNKLATADIGRLVSVVARELGSLGHEPEPPTGSQPAVPVQDSVHRDYLVCLVCAKSFKSLRRHLQTSHELTPPDYRRTFGLPGSYPMVAAASTEQHATIARRNNFARRRQQELMGEPAVPAAAATTPGPGGTTQHDMVSVASPTPQPALRPVRGRRTLKAADVTIGSALAQQPQPDPEPGRQPRRKAESEPS